MVTARRHIFLLLDGTSCTAADGYKRDFSNVFRIGGLLHGFQSKSTRAQNPNNATEPHIVLYFPGPGTRRVLFRWWNGISGSETNEIVREAYLALCNNIASPTEDKIYIIGFSRGAAAAKILIALIAKCGLLQKSELHQFGNLWKAFARQANNSRFYGRTAKPVNISFVGLFDPVSGPRIGRINYKISEDIDHNIESAIELISIDERRRFYKPRLWRNTEVLAKNVVAPPFPAKPRLQQIWMPGGHSDIGHPENGKVVADIALLTMLERLSTLSTVRLNTTAVASVLADVLHRANTFRISFKRPILAFKRRSIPLSKTTEIHPLYFTILNEKIDVNGIIQLYKGVNQINFDKMRTYDFNIDNICQKTDAFVHINKELVDAISQNT